MISRAKGTIESSLEVRQRDRRVGVLAAERLAERIGHATAVQRLRTADVKDTSGQCRPCERAGHTSRRVFPAAAATIVMEASSDLFMASDAPTETDGFVDAAFGAISFLAEKLVAWKFSRSRGMAQACASGGVILTEATRVLGGTTEPVGGPGGD